MGLSSGSRKTRIETYYRLIEHPDARGLSSGSRKTRIETRMELISQGVTLKV